MRSRADRFAAALDALVEEHGGSALAKSDVTLTKVVGLVLSRWTSPSQAQKTVESLTSEFVDWNEVRISYVREISVVLSASGWGGDTKAFSRDLIAFLNRLYRDHNAVSLDSVQEMEPQDAFAYLRGIEFLGPGVAAGTFALLFKAPHVLHAPDVLRLPGRLGLAGKRATQTKVRKVLETLLDGDHHVLAHLYFALHSEDVCRSRAPRCTKCSLVGSCEYGKGAAKAQAGGPKATPAPVKKAKAKKKPTKKTPAKKTPTKKTPTKKTPTKKTPAKKTPAKKTPAKKTPPRDQTAGKSGGGKKTN